MKKNNCFFQQTRTKEKSVERLLPRRDDQACQERVFRIVWIRIWDTQVLGRITLDPATEPVKMRRPVQAEARRVLGKIVKVSISCFRAANILFLFDQMT